MKIRLQLLGVAALVTGLSQAKTTAPASSHSLRSGVEIGQSLTAFTPVHVTGADKGTTTCPVCKYGIRPAVQVWVNTDDEKNIAAIARTLESATRKNKSREFKAFVVFMNPSKEKPALVSSQLTKLAETNHLKNVALTYLKNPSDPANFGQPGDPVVKRYQINPDKKVKNTVFVYTQGKVVSKFVNLVADDGGAQTLASAIQRAVNNRSAKKG